VKVAEALDLIRRVGAVENSEGNLKLKFPEARRAALQHAIDTLRKGKAEALELLAESLTERGPTPANTETAKAEPLESVLKNRTIELWSTATGRLFLVADEEDGRKAMVRLGPRRGEIYTAAEARRIIAVRDPAVVAEIHQWKNRFNGAVRDFRAGDHSK
jgi:hypothetical protein